MEGAANYKWLWLPLLGLFLQGNPGITSRQHRMKSMSVYDLCECFFRLTGAEAKAIFKVLLICVPFSHFFLPPVPLYLLLLLCPLGPPSPLSTLATAPAPNPGHSPARSLSALFFCSCTSSHSPPLSSASYYSPVVLILCLQFPSMMTSDFLRAGRTPAHWVCPSACRCWAGLIPSVQNSFIRATNTIQAPSWWETREAFLPLSLTWPRPQAGP